MKLNSERSELSITYCMATIIMYPLELLIKLPCLLVVSDVMCVFPAETVFLTFSTKTIELQCKIILSLNSLV